jgi:hypothetical protein
VTVKVAAKRAAETRARTPEQTKRFIAASQSLR